MSEDAATLTGGPRDRVAHEVADGVFRIEDAHVNWYLVEEAGALTVVDAGHPRSWRSLHAALAQIGRRPADVEAVVLTHGHFDHVGFAERARTELGVPVWAPEGDLHLARHPWSYRHERSRALWALRHPAFVGRMAAMARAGALTVPGVRDARPYAGGDELDVPGSPRAVATPGHTAGHCALHLAGRDVLIAGDALVTWDPYTGCDGPRIIPGAATADTVMALRSLRAVQATDATTVLTGHGPPWTEGAAAAVGRALRAAAR